MRVNSSAARLLLGAGATAAFLLANVTGGAQGQAPTPAAGQAPAGARGGGGGRGGAGGGVAPAVFTMADINKDGAVTRGELMTTLEKWYANADTAKAGSITAEQLSTALNAAFPAPPAPAGPACGGNSVSKTPCPDHVSAMMAALPDKAPAKPAKPRKILVLGNANGFVHSSIPIAGATVEALGKKLNTWTTTITYNPADINTENLKQYDLVYLASNTGCFLDGVPGQTPATKADVDARRAALLAFVRGGKGIAGVHAATDSYHSTCATAESVAAAGAGGAGGGGRGGGRGAGGGPAGQLQAQLLASTGKPADAKLTLADFDMAANAWFDKMDTDKAGKLAQPAFETKLTEVLVPAGAAGGRGAGVAGGRRGGGRGAGADGTPVGRGSTKLPAEGSWPEFNKMVGGYFKFHWVDGTHIPVKIDDPKSPLNKAFVDKTVEASNGAAGVFSKAIPGKGYEIVDETYTFAQDSFSRTNVHVLTSVDYAAMPQTTKDMEPAATARSDGDYALSYIRREGQGRVFYEANGHNEKIYAVPAMLQHTLAGIQYALGDLKADDSPSVKAAAKK